MGLFAGLAVWGLAIGGFPPILQARVLRLSSTAFRPLAGSVVITVLNLGIAGGATLGGLALGYGEHALVLIATTAAAVGTLTLALLPGAGPGPRTSVVNPPRRPRRTPGIAR